jgi:hypothetical protein
MRRSGSRRVGQLLVATVAVAALLLRPAAATPAAAAATDDGLELISSTTYTLVPEKSLVHVAVALTAKNTKPNVDQQTPNGTITTRYFFDSATIAVQPEATGVVAKSGRKHLGSRLTPDDGFARLKVAFPSDLYFDQTVTVSLAFDLPGGAPRSASDIRVGPAFATFPAWAFGDSGDVQVVVPGGYDVQSSGSPTEETEAAGVTTLKASGIADATDWYSIIVADRHDALTQDRLDLAGGEHLVIRAWPEDTEWRTRVTDLLTRSLPDLVDRIGLEWPVSRDIEVSEVHTPLLEGYAGIFHTSENLIEISEDLDELTIVHEASHAWFNDKLIVGRWIDEGLADEYASLVLADVASGGENPNPVAPTDAEAVRLNAWTFPGRIADAATQARETYGYEASWTAIRALVSDVGEAGMRDVLAAANKRETPYVGAAPAEKVLGPADWKRFLDLLDERGHADKADDIFRRWVVTDDQAKVLDARAVARTAYAGLLADGHGWLPGWVVRKPMTEWDFATAALRIKDAEKVLDLRNRIDIVAAHLGLKQPGTLRKAYEAENEDLATVQALGTRELALVASVGTAGQRAAAERPPLTLIGLLGSNPDGELAAARAAFSSGDLDGADADLAAMNGLLDGAIETGRERVAVAGLATAGALAVGGVAVYGVHRRRRRVALRKATAAAALSVPAPPAPVEPPTIADVPASAQPSVAPEGSGAAEPSTAPEASAPAAGPKPPPRKRRSRAKPPTPPEAPDAPEPYATLGDPRPAGTQPDPPADGGPRRRRRNVRRAG